jgi:hypothetical protein
VARTDPAITCHTVPDNRFTLEGHDLVIVEVGRLSLPPRVSPAYSSPGRQADCAAVARIG